MRHTVRAETGIVDRCGTRTGNMYIRQTTWWDSKDDLRRFEWN